MDTDGNPCTVATCDSNNVCVQSTPVQRGQGKVGCAGYCDGMGNCVDCVDDANCGECQACNTMGLCEQKAAGSPCPSAVDCSEYIWGEAPTSSGGLGCFAFARGNGLGGTCTINGNCYLDPASACSMVGPGASVVECGDSRCRHPNLAPCTRFAPIGDVTFSTFCAVSAQTPECAAACDQEFPTVYNGFFCDVGARCTFTYNSCVPGTCRDLGGFAGCSTECNRNEDCAPGSFCMGTECQ